MLGFPDLTPGAMAKLAEIAKLEKAASAAWETEPRLPSGQAGGGQWTTGGGAPSSAQLADSKKPLADGGGPNSPGRGLSSGRLDGSGARASVQEEACNADAADPSLLIHVNTAAVAAAGIGGARDFALPEGVARLGRAGLLAYVAALLDRLGASNAQRQITNAVSRFGLDSSQPADVMAASAYVWSRYALPVLTDAPFSGPKLDAASQAVMRFVLVNPGAFGAIFEGSEAKGAESQNFIVAAANAGLADYAMESRARPLGVAPELQTTSKSARAAIADMLKNGRMQAHHLVPAQIWGENADIAAIAKEDGWNQDNPYNLIALPQDMATWEYYQGQLPMHFKGHPIYSAVVRQEIQRARVFFPNPTPVQAHAIFDSAALHARFRILSGQYNPIMKSGR
jgi:hypothetical protein